MDAGNDKRKAGILAESARPQPVCAAVGGEGFRPTPREDRPASVDSRYWRRSDATYAAPACSEFQVVDQARAAQAGRDQGHVRTGVAVARLAEVGQPHHCVIDPETSLLQRVAGRVFHLRARRADGIAVAHLQQHLVDIGRDRALFGRQILIARAHRQAIGLAHDAAAQDLDRKRQVGHHLPDHSQLLVILLAEGGHVRLHLIEQPRHHGAYAIEMPRPAFALKHIADAGRVDGRGQRGAEWVHRVHVRQPQRIAAGIFQAAQVGLGRTRVARKIFIRAELGRVDEHAGHHTVGVLARQHHQRVMPDVQVAHGGHQRHAQALALPAVDQSAQGGKIGECLDHAAYACSASGKLPSRTACA
ncbi:ATPases involved in chromosome partitioning [Xanthomonas oryzae pv. oryzae KACC 10331]|uniref:ATPases involved in chromosome partitioning n=2 Tax=Xanthomonas oryzae TaxID=347 RepID=Q5H0A5_XANOR|nr:ATPases involved in chromosome partitioning [Xanthomonas oryzae pv. oryzae KACC 10331]